MGQTNFAGAFQDLLWNSEISENRPNPLAQICKTLEATYQEFHGRDKMTHRDSMDKLCKTAGIGDRGSRALTRVLRHKSDLEDDMTSGLYVPLMLAFNTIKQHLYRNCAADLKSMLAESICGLKPDPPAFS